MSCIPKILELKGDKEFLPVPGREDHYGDNTHTVVECGGSYKGYHWLVVFQDLGFRCGYVALPSNHPLNENKKDYLSDVHLEVHGGVTFFEENHLSHSFFGEKACTDKWVGFDAGHAFDMHDLDAAIKYFPKLRSSKREHIERMNEIMGMKGSYPCEIRTKEYMEQECKNLIDQLIDKEVA